MDGGCFEMDFNSYQWTLKVKIAGASLSLQKSTPVNLPLSWVLGENSIANRYISVRRIQKNPNPYEIEL